jgi:hypothetical protein
LSNEWSDQLPVIQFRIARPTDNLKAVVQFYRDGIGLKEIGSFQEHAGYAGVMLGLPGTAYHLEFTQHNDGSPCPAPTKDNLLVFYIADKAPIFKIVKRLAELGYHAVAPENPYWQSNGITIEDPDGWRIVLMNTSGINDE